MRLLALLLLPCLSALAQPTPAYIFVSPNTSQQLSLPQAVGALNSTAQRRLMRAAPQVLCRIGAKGTASDGVAIWVDGAENTLVLRTVADEDAAHYAAAWLASRAKRGGALVFLSSHEGPERLYTLRFAAQPIREVVRMLARHRIVDATIITQRKRMLVLAPGSQQDLRHIQSAAADLGAAFTTVAGKLTLLGDSFDREKGVAELARIVADHERLHPAVKRRPCESPN